LTTGIGRECLYKVQSYSGEQGTESWAGRWVGVSKVSESW